MKVLCRISLFFAIASFGFAGGVYANKLYSQKPENNMPNEQKQYMEYSGSLKENTNAVNVSAASAKIDCDTLYLVKAYDTNLKNTQETPEELPAKYIGMEREALEKEIESYSKSPSLRDLEKGFLSAHLVSFSNEQIIVQKNYGIPEEKEYYLAVDHNYLIVYENDKETVYTTTDILIEDLPKDLQEEIMNMKMLGSEEEVYHFLESHSS